MKIVTRPPRLVALSDARVEQAREPGEFVSTPAGTVHAVVRGTGPDVVLLHGVTDNAHTWHAVQAELLGEARTHAIDLPGHGLTDIPGEPLSSRDMASWVAAYLEASGVSRAAVVGWSLGGSVAVALAASEPSRVRSLVLESSAVLEFPFPSALFPLKVCGVAELMFRIAAWPSVRRFFMSATFAPGYDPAEEIVERYWRGWQIRGHARYTRALLRSFATRDTTPLLAEVRAPAWVIHGDQDQLIPARIGRELATRLSRAELCALEGVGHAPHIERPDAVLRAIRDALGAA